MCLKRFSFSYTYKLLCCLLETDVKQASLGFHLGKTTENKPTSASFPTKTMERNAFPACSRTGTDKKWPFLRVPERKQIKKLGEGYLSAAPAPV